MGVVIEGVPLRLGTKTAQTRSVRSLYTYVCNQLHDFQVTEVDLLVYWV